jgi:hypothetical protein
MFYVCTVLASSFPYNYVHILLWLMVKEAMNYYFCLMLSTFFGRFPKNFFLGKSLSCCLLMVIGRWPMWVTHTHTHRQIAQPAKIGQRANGRINFVRDTVIDKQICTKSISENIAVWFDAINVWTSDWNGEQLYREIFRRVRETSTESVVWQHPCCF